jgi:Zn-dependent protease
MIMGILWALVALAGNRGLGGGMFSEAMVAMGSAGISINLSLLIFNLLPIPPLDGSRVVLRFLKGKALDIWESMEQYGMFIILGLSLLGLLGFWFTPWMNVFSWIPAIAYF